MSTLAAGAMLGGLRSASAQWNQSGSNLTTADVVGIGTTAPNWNAEISGGSLMRLAINSTLDGSGNGNGGIILSMNETDKWSIGNTQTISGLLSVNTFQIFDQTNGRNALTLDQSSSSNTANFNGVVEPAVDNTFTLGATGRRWKAVYAANGTIQTSDRRQKKDIADLAYGLPQIMKLRPVTFKWRQGSDPQTHVGLIAQDVEKIIPEVVVHGSTDSEPLAMSYTELVPILIKAVQTQEGTIEAQQQRIARLEGRAGLSKDETAARAVGGGAALACVPMLGVWALNRRRRRLQASS